MIFKSEKHAREYLKTHIPEEEDDEKEVDLEILKKPLFEIPEDDLEGKKYEFSNNELGLQVSFELQSSKYMLQRAMMIYQSANVDGRYLPIFSMANLSINTENFSYNIKEDDNVKEIFWLPKLKNADNELGYDYADIQRKNVYMIDKEGFLSKPIDYLALFHEAGHLHTRTPQEDIDEINSLNENISTAKGFTMDENKFAAYELKRERDANAWMEWNCRKLFDDLGISRELVNDYIHQAQLSGYNKLAKIRFDKNKIDEE